MSQPDFQQHVSYNGGMPSLNTNRAMDEPSNNHYYGYPPLPNYHYPNFRDNFPGFQQQPHYHHCGPQQTHSYAPAWPLNKQQFSNQIPQQSVKVESSSTPPKASNKMELARLMHHDIKPDPIHLGMSILNLPNNQTNQLQSTPSVPPPLLNQLTTNSTMDSNITLWQFLLEMLTNGEHTDLIQWTNSEGEFKLIDAEAVARLWGVRKGKHQMNYDKLSRALRYYYDKQIIKKVNGQKFVYRFVVPSESLGTNADMLSYTMQRSMGIHQPSQSPANSLLPPPSTSLPRPMPTNHSVLGTNDQRFVRHLVPSIKTDGDSSSSRPLTVTNTASTPSPINSICSPGSSSGVSSAGTSASNMSDFNHHAGQPHPNNQSSANSGPSSRPSSTASVLNYHQNKRKRKCDDNGSSSERIKIEPPTSYYGNGANENIFVDAQSPTNGLSRRPRPKPLPLDLSAVSNVNNGLSSLNNNAMNNLVAAASPMLQNSPALFNIYAATLSANLMQQSQSPLNNFMTAALTSPLFAAAASIAATSPTINPLNINHNNNNLSMFGTSLSALNTPIPTRTPQQSQTTSQSHGQFFQFPPSSQASAHFALAALLGSPGLHSPFLTAMGLGTPTAQSNGTKFNLSPNDALKTPMPQIREV